MILFDVLRKKVLESNVNNFTDRLPTDNFSRGIYFLDIWSRGRKFKKKIVIN
ncbi:T9SS type A sorting domain-containing protein [Tenacibaculum xiamenense]|uniref:T9SS type A sorting domain-containing protein n=1 Tax=Tenacibaculum xiamenense TaxID=1261553 RepID=UPI0038B56A2A